MPSNQYDFTTDSRTVARTLDHTVRRSDIHLISLNHITSEYMLEYFKDLAVEDLPHNMDIFFEELRTIHELLCEEINNLKEYKLDLETKIKPIEDRSHVQ
jgi:hypothetical protein